MRNNRHYHVLVGLPGYMPDVNWPCRTLTEARDCAQEEADQFRQDWDPDANRSYYSVVGNKQDGYEVLRRDASEWALPIVISINECCEDECTCPECGEPLLEFACDSCGWQEDD